MRLSQMNADQLFHTLSSMAAPVCALLEDEQVQQALAQLTAQRDRGVPRSLAWPRLAADLAPLLLQRRREETLQIASALLDRPVQALRAENGIALIRALCDCWEEELADFFSCAADTAGRLC